MYFTSFPKIYYDSKGQGNPKVVTNLLKRIAIRSKVKSNTMLYDTYDVKNGETPESIADKLYNDSELHWVVLMVNDITDRYHEWPLKEQQFNTYVNEKYTNPDGVHHYEVSQESGDTTTKVEVYNPDLLTDAGALSDSDAYSSATAVTNREYEESQQDEKRKIRLLDPRYVSQFVDEYQRLIKESII
tara:strand:- start:1201 stop:1761 length:561 start_codon:yes stop_codon:yes gene_type:complete